MKKIDFLPERIKRQRRRSRLLKKQGAALAAVFAVLCGLGYFNHGRVRSVRAELVMRQRDQQAMQSRLAMIPELMAQQADGRIKQRISEELGSRVDVRAVMAELGRLLPPSSALLSMELSTIEMRSGAAARLEGQLRAPTQPRVKLLITGVAPTDVDVANFIGQLSASPLFEDVNMGYSRTIQVDDDRRDARSFQVSCLLPR